MVFPACRLTKVTSGQIGRQSSCWSVYECAALSTSLCVRVPVCVRECDVCVWIAKAFLAGEHMKTSVLAPGRLSTSLLQSVETELSNTGVCCVTGKTVSGSRCSVNVISPCLRAWLVSVWIQSSVLCPDPDYVVLFTAFTTWSWRANSVRYQSRPDAETVEQHIAVDVGSRPETVFVSFFVYFTRQRFVRIRL